MAALRHECHVLFEVKGKAVWILHVLMEIPFFCSRPKQGRAGHEIGEGAANAGHRWPQPAFWVLASQNPGQNSGFGFPIVWNLLESRQSPTPLSPIVNSDQLCLHVVSLSLSDVLAVCNATRRFFSAFSLLWSSTLGCLRVWQFPLHLLVSDLARPASCPLPH